MRFRGIVILLVLVFAVITLSNSALSACDTLVTLPSNFTYQTPPATLGGTGIVTGEIRDAESNCPWTLPVVVAVVNASGYTVGPGDEIVGTIGVYYGPFECTPTTHYTIDYVNVTGPGNYSYRVIAYYNITGLPMGVVTVIGMSPPFTISSIGDTVTQDITIYGGINCTPTATTTTTTATTTPPTTTTTTTTSPPPTTTTSTPLPGLGVMAVVMLVFAAFVRSRDRNRKE